MTYDQAQSPRLGQRTPVESTYVRMFAGTELPEVSWPGQLIFRSDTGILQVYDGVAQAWLDVGGGVAGQLTYVGPTQPVVTPPDTFMVGDTWYDTDDAYRQYVWDGDSWELVIAGITTYRQATAPLSSSIGDVWYDTSDGNAMYRAASAGTTAIGPSGWVLVQDQAIDAAQTTADDAHDLAETKTQVFYAAGWVDDDGDPATDLVRVGPVGVTPGDIWYQTDDANHMFMWDGAFWVDVKDPSIDLVADTASQNEGAIVDLNLALENVSLTASSAQNSADSADGRVSMSDYMPGPDDVGGRNEGSIWFTRTRPRRNLCTNPSFETNTNFWTGTECSFVRDNSHPEPAGSWTLKVTNSAVATDHYVAWGATTHAPCDDGQIYTASIFAQLVSGLGLGVYLQLRWYDASNALITTNNSPPFDLEIGAFDPTTFGTRNEPRIYVTATAPTGAVSLNARTVSPSGNANDVWNLGELLIEQEDDLGRYFDGDSYDGVWDGTAHNSTSYLNGDKIIQLWELRDSDWMRKYLTDNTLGTIDAVKLTGTIDGAMIEDNSLVPDKNTAVPVVATQALAVGDLVNIWSNNGVHSARKADSSLRYPAHGFVWTAATIGANATVYHVGYNPYLTNLAPGNQWLGLAGKCSNQPPASVGSLVQRVGFSPAPTVLNFDPAQTIRIT